MWGDGEFHAKKTLFGDTFGMRTDYTAGTFYRGRMQYLQTEPDVNILEPPMTFKTKKQAKSSSRVKEISFQKLNFPKKETEGENLITKSQSKKTSEGTKKQIQKKQQQQQPDVLLQTIVEVVPEDWTEEFQAGCKMWVNHSTGEVSNECPWTNNEEKEQSPAKAEPADNLGGTGALVYDSSQLDELFEILDEKSQRK